MILSLTALIPAAVASKGSGNFVNPKASMLRPARVSGEALFAPLTGVIVARAELVACYMLVRKDCQTSNIS